MSHPYITPATIDFLYDLAANNNREWFAENKAHYELCVREPSLRLIEDAGPLLARISEHFVASPKKVGGSLMRVYRDTRFARDKTPYKTNIGIQFRHYQGKDVHAPGFYLHVGLDETFIGIGIWRPDSNALSAIRTAIDEQGRGWKTALRSLNHGLDGGQGFQLQGDSLKRPPRGFDKDHPLLEDLKRKDFIAIQHLSYEQLLADDYLDQVFAAFAASRPFMAYLCKALKLPC